MARCVGQGPQGRTPREFCPDLPWGGVWGRGPSRTGSLLLCRLTPCPLPLALSPPGSGGRSSLLSEESQRRGGLFFFSLWRCPAVLAARNSSEPWKAHLRQSSALARVCICMSGNGGHTSLSFPFSWPVTGSLAGSLLQTKFYGLEAGQRPPHVGSQARASPGRPAHAVWWSADPLCSSLAVTLSAPCSCVDLLRSCLDPLTNEALKCARLLGSLSFPPVSAAVEGTVRVGTTQPPTCAQRVENWKREPLHFLPRRPFPTSCPHFMAVNVASPAGPCQPLLPQEASLPGDRGEAPTAFGAGRLSQAVSSRPVWGLQHFQLGSTGRWGSRLQVTSGKHLAPWDFQGPTFPSQVLGIHPFPEELEMSWRLGELRL